MKFIELVNSNFDRYEKAFEKLKGENEFGHISITRNKNATIDNSDFELIVDVKKVGPYKFKADIAEQHLQLQSPDTVYSYIYDENNGFWKSTI